MNTCLTSKMNYSIATFPRMTFLNSIFSFKISFSEQYMKTDNEKNGHLDVISIDRFLVELKILSNILVLLFFFLI